MKRLVSKAIVAFFFTSTLIGCVQTFKAMASTQSAVYAVVK